MFKDVTLTTTGKVVFGGLFLLILIPVIVYGFRLAQDRTDSFSELSVPNVGGEVLEATADETSDVLSRVGKILVLPENETPQVAVISDVSKLKDKDIFKNAKNGDYVLVYSQSRKVILYRPGENKVVDVMTITVRDQNLPAQTTVEPDILSSPTPVLEVTEAPNATSSSQVDTQ